MKKLTFLMLTALLLSGCKLGGEAVNITQPIVLQESVTGETLTLTMDGAFSFAHEFEPGDAYNVVIAKKPDDLICGVENANGVFGEEDITNLVVSCEEDRVFCPLNYDPVCGKAQTDIVCITQPCETHQYSTFSNGCFAAGSKAMITFKGACGGLEDAVAFSDKPVMMLAEPLSGDTGQPYQIRSSEISGNRLTLTLQYAGGCGEHQFTLEAEQKLGSNESPVANVQLVHSTDDTCEAAITSEVQFDLLPIKEFYSRQFEETTGEVELKDLGIYRF